jgi:hypothetical protein
MQLAAVKNDDVELTFFQAFHHLLKIFLTAFGKNICRLSP